MSTPTPLKLALTAALLVGSSAALAIPFGSFDSRSMAMGGAGVAVGAADAAPLFNPALLSVTNPKDDFSLIIPTVGIRVADPDSLREDFNTFKDGNYIDNLKNSISTLALDISNNNWGSIDADAAAIGNDLVIVSEQLGTMSNKPITADVGLATVVAIPSKTFGVAFFANGTVTAGGLFNYTTADRATFAGLVNDVLNCKSTDLASAACTNLKNFDTSTLTSGIHVKGVQLSEFGFALSREMQIKESNIALGITPKIVKARLFDTEILASNPKQSQSADDYMADYSYFNFDLGAAKDYGNGWRSGFVLKNVMPQTLDFKKSLVAGTTPVATGETLTLKPQARIGVSHANSWSTVALDVDLTRNDPAGLEHGTQYVALGGELDAWGWAQLRAGYRVDLVNSARNVASLGLGLAPFGVVHIDVAVAGNANEVGGSFQLGVHF